MQAPNQASLDFQHYASAFRRNWRLILAVTAAAVALALAYSFVRTPVYAATAEVLVNPITTNPFEQDRPDLLVQPDTERQIATSTAVAERAAEKLGTTQSPQSLLRRLKAEAPADTRILQITFSDTDPAAAQRGAQAFAEAYLEFKRDEAEETRARLAAGFQRELAQANEVFEEALADLGNAEEGSPEAEAARTRADVASTRVFALMNKLIEIRTIDLSPGQIIVSPEIPRGPASPNRKLDLTLGLVGGALLGMAIALWRQRSGDRLERSEELDSALGAPTLAVVPSVREWRDRDRAELISVSSPLSPAAEAYRTLRTGILAMAHERGIKTLLVLSAGEGEGKTSTVANLGVVLAEAGKRVILISADLRKPRLHEFFRLPNDRGLSDVLTGTLPAMEAVHMVRPHLLVLPSGPVPAGPSELMQSARMRDLLTERPPGIDFILLDGAPVLPVADSLALAPATDGVLFVADASQTRRDAVLQARSRLERVGARVIGAVLNNIEASTAGYYGYGGQYGETPRPARSIIRPRTQKVASPAPALPDSWVAAPRAAVPPPSPAVESPAEMSLRAPDPSTAFDASDAPGPSTFDPDVSDAPDPSTAFEVIDAPDPSTAPDADVSSGSDSDMLPDSELRPGSPADQGRPDGDDSGTIPPPPIDIPLPPTGNGSISPDRPRSLYRP